MPVVLDTNVLISAVLKAGSVPGRALLLAEPMGLLASVATLDELSRKLRQSKFDRWSDLDTRLEFLKRVGLSSTEVTITVRIAACRDPDDDKFLELAVNGHATHLVTGDLDLLALHPFRGIAILTAADFVAAVAPGA